MKTKRLFDFLTEQLEKNPNNKFLSSKVSGTWKDYTFADTQYQSNRVSQLLINIGLKKDDKIAIISANRPEWNFTDLGAQQLGITAVPMYPTISEHDYEYIFNDAGIQYAFVGDATILKKVQPLFNKCKCLKGIYIFDKENNATYFWDMLPKEINETAIQIIKDTINEEDLATIIYTSGTTGNPKGVMLTHKNIVSNINGIKQVIHFGYGEKSLSFLPLCHSFERMVFYAYLSFGIHIHYAENLEKIADNLQEVKPYCFTTVPRLLEKVYEKIMAKGTALTGMQKKLFYWAMNVGAAYELGKDKGWWYNLQLKAARKLVFTKWQEALGGNVQFIITGAAAMQPRLITLFTAAGINVIEGYGLTETSPVISCNLVEETKRCIGTVGIPIPTVEVKMAEDGEIIIKGDNVMKGYYGRQDLTDEVIDKDGWFHTGDIGTWIERGDNKFLKITDRKKELFKTAGGKYIAPQAIENKFKESNYIEQLMVVGGDDKKYISALIIPSFPQLEIWAKENNILTNSKESLIANPKIVELFNNEIKHLNTYFGQWEQIKKFVLLPNDWTQDSGELTPTMKLKRKFISEKFKMEIESLGG